MAGLSSSERASFSTKKEWVECAQEVSRGNRNVLKRCFPDPGSAAGDPHLANMDRLAHDLQLPSHTAADTDVGAGAELAETAQPSNESVPPDTFG